MPSGNIDYNSQQCHLSLNLATAAFNDQTLWRTKTLTIGLNTIFFKNT